MFWHFARVFVFYSSSAYSLIYIYVHVCKRIVLVQQGWDAKRQDRIAFLVSESQYRNPKKNCPLKTKDKEKKRNKNATLTTVYK